MSQSFVLIVEDDRFQQTIVESMVSKFLDLPTRSVGDGRAALEIVKESMPSLIICDLHMPKVDGIDFLFELAQFETYPAIFILSSMDNSIQRSVAGMADQLGLKSVKTIQKPLTADKFQSATSKLDLSSAYRKAEQFQSPHSFTKQALLDGLENHEFVAFYQPQVDAKSKDIVSVESLVRWNHPNLGVLSPFHFLDKISEHELDFELFKTVCEQSIELASECRAAGNKLSVSVNAAPSDLCNDQCIPFIFRCLEKYQFSAELLTIEMTESEAVMDMQKLLYAVNKLRVHGIKLAIDDFGTGNSTLTQMISSPFTELKIDLSFVREMLVSEKHFAAVSTSILLAHQVGLKVVAEGVETQEQTERLVELNCDVLQGYCFSKPLEKSAFLALMSNQLD